MILNKELLKLKKELVKMSTPSREEQVAKALRVVFSGLDEGITEKEAFDILGWGYESRSEIFGEDEEKINDVTISDFGDTNLVVCNNLDIPDVKDDSVRIINIVPVSSREEA